MSSIIKKTDNILRDGVFRKSSASGGGNCVEVAKLHDGSVQVRDSKDSKKTTLSFTPGEWVAFLKGVRQGEFEI